MAHVPYTACAFVQTLHWSIRHGCSWSGEGIEVTEKNRNDYSLKDRIPVYQCGISRMNMISKNFKGTGNIFLKTDTEPQISRKVHFVHFDR